MNETGKEYTIPEDVAESLCATPGMLLRALCRARLDMKWERYRESFAPKGARLPCFRAERMMPL